MKCAKCENIQKDPNTGMLICLACGNVADDLNIVQSIEFDGDQKATGTFVGMDGPTYFSMGGRNTLSQMIDPTQIRLNKVYKEMLQVASVLTIPTNVVDRAKKLYNIASNKKFTQGRKTKQIVGAVLYLACRWACTKHLLIDFSEVLQMNLFVIGSAYLKLVKLLNLEIRIIDPSLYMHRYCNKLEFGNKAREVENTALKILQFLKRDWITTGRRPSGLCGACILISSKLHGFKRTIDEIANVVHVCNETIKKRIYEFSLTKVSMMTKEEFDKFEESHYYLGMDPPAFIRNREKDKEEEKQRSGGEKAENTNLIIQQEAKEDLFLRPNPVNISAKDKPEPSEFLSVLEERDEMRYLYSNNEYIIRKNIWEIMYRDWIEEQNDKREHEKTLPPDQKKIKLRKISAITATSQISAVSHTSPYDAIKSSTKFGRKINYSFVKTLFKKDNNSNDNNDNDNDNNNNNPN